MSAIARTIDDRLSRLPPPRAARLERLIIGLLDLMEPVPDPADDETEDRRRREQALAALDRIAARGGITGIPDPVAWQREQRNDRPLPGREP
jgi:hypothetical protein